MKMIRKLGVAAALLASTQVATASTLTNMGFESGLTPWTGSGSVGTGSLAYTGTHYGQIVGNQTLSQQASLSAGSTYEFMWRFISTDTTPGFLGLLPDISYVVKGGAQNLFTLSLNTLLGNASILQTSGTSVIDTGWQHFSWVAPTSYTGSVTFGVLDHTGLNNSKLLLDAPVPLPAAAWLFGSALLGAGALRRKQAAAKKSEMAAA